MKKTFKLVGLDCAHCADMIEKAVSRVDGVEKIIKKMEPDVKVVKI